MKHARMVAAWLICFGVAYVVSAQRAHAAPPTCSEVDGVCLSPAVCAARGGGPIGRLNCATSQVCCT